MGWFGGEKNPLFLGKHPNVNVDQHTSYSPAPIFRVAEKTPPAWIFFHVRKVRTFLQHKKKHRKKLPLGGGFLKGSPRKINVEHNSLEVWKSMFLSKWVICRFHANLPGCASCSILIMDEAGRQKGHLLKVFHEPKNRPQHLPGKSFYLSKWEFHPSKLWNASCWVPSLLLEWNGSNGWIPRFVMLRIRSSPRFASIQVEGFFDDWVPTFSYLTLPLRQCSLS